jgi:alpha-D-xyloside xylohydrolase
VYLPPGNWIDYQTGKSYSAGWHTIAAGEIPVVLLVRDGAAIPHIALAPSTSRMDWGSIELVVFAAEAQGAEALVYLPSGEALQRVSVVRKGGRFVLTEDPLRGEVTWRVRGYGDGR